MTKTEELNRQNQIAWMRMELEAILRRGAFLPGQGWTGKGESQDDKRRKLHLVVLRAEDFKPGGVLHVDRHGNRVEPTKSPKRQGVDQIDRPDADSDY